MSIISNTQLSLINIDALCSYECLSSWHQEVLIWYLTQSVWSMYRLLDTLPPYLYYELLPLLSTQLLHNDYIYSIIVSYSLARWILFTRTFMADLRSVVWSSLTYSEYYNSIIYYSTNVWLTDFTLFSITKSTSTEQSSKFMTRNKTIEWKYIVSHALNNNYCFSGLEAIHWNC